MSKADGIELTLTDEITLGGIRFEPGFYRVTRLLGSPGPWWCGDCGEPVAGKFARCPKCGPCKAPYGHSPF